MKVSPKSTQTDWLECLRVSRQIHDFDRIHKDIGMEKMSEDSVVGPLEFNLGDLLRVSGEDKHLAVGLWASQIDFSVSQTEQLG